MSAPSRPRRVPGVLLATAAVSGLVAGCGGGSGGTDGGAAAASATVHPAASTSAAGTGTSALAKGLLPADAFGPGARVAAQDLGQLKQEAGGLGGLSAALAGVQVTPPECATALQAVRPDVAGIDDLAVETATGQGSLTAEALLSGGPAGSAVGTVRDLLAGCAQVQVTAPRLGQASIAVAPVQLGKLGDAAAAVRVTVVVTRPEHPAMTVPALVGAVQDGDRLLLLATVATNGTPPDEAAFTSLLRKAVSTEHDALD
jgi:hypothetical protein